MADLSVSYMGLQLRNPIIAGSSGLTNSMENILKLYRHGAGAIVLKSLFEEQINLSINRKSYLGENNYSYPEALDYISQFTFENDLEQYLQLISDAKRRVDIPIIGSINFISSSEWATFAKNMQDAGADALELNMFILPSDPKRKSEQLEQIYFDIIKSVMKQVKIPVAAKISSYFSGMTNMAVQLSGTGISGLVFFNRFYSPDIDIDKFEITTNHLFSSPAEMSQTLRWVALLSDRVHCDIAASTGVHDGESVIKLLLAGAKAVQVASVLYQKGFGHIDVMLKDIEQWMNKHKFDNTSGFIGRMSIKEVKNPAAFERVQFMKDFSSIE